MNTALTLSIVPKLCLPYKQNTGYFKPHDNMNTRYLL